MALGRSGLFFRRLTRSDGGAANRTTSNFQRIEERQRTLAKATEEWLSLLQEMEHAGQSSEPRYETYYRAYLQAKQQQKRLDLELFNLRKGLSQ
jgi:hypothetical protein